MIAPIGGGRRGGLCLACDRVIRTCPSRRPRYSNVVHAPAVRAGLAAFATIMALAITPAAAQLYRWTDNEGTVHYTSDLATIPLPYREGVKDIGSPTPGSEEETTPEARDV